MYTLNVVNRNTNRDVAVLFKKIKERGKSMQVKRIQGVGKTEFGAVKDFLKNVKRQSNILGNVITTGFIGNCEVKRMDSKITVSQTVGFLTY